MRKTEQENVRREVANQLDRCGTIRNLADDHESWFGFEKTTQPVAKNRVLTGNDQPDEFGGDGFGYPVATRFRGGRGSPKGGRTTGLAG